jgi:hypothetical protein
MKQDPKTKCSTLGCDTRKSSSGYCVPCFVAKFGENQSKRRKTKEKVVVDFVCSEFSWCDIRCDRRIEGGCSSRRPDIFIDMGSKVVIVEVDENQHSSYDNYCEQARINQLSFDVGSRPIIVIRFNPDKYKLGNRLVRSPFERTDKGFWVVRDKQQLEERLSVLKASIESAMESEYCEPYQEQCLFYDQ